MFLLRKKQANETVAATRGFTLIEILLVIGIIAVMAAVVIVALDPAKRFADARDSRRLSDVQSILSAVQQYIIDNKGAIPSGVDIVEKQIGSNNSGCIVAGGCNVSEDGDCVDPSDELAKYLKSVPYDPQNGSTEATHYSIQADANNIVTVRACDAEGDPISVSR